MTPNELIELFITYNLIPSEESQEALELIDEEFPDDIELHVLELLAEYAYEDLIEIAVGDCVAEEVIASFLSNFDAVKELSNHTVEAQNIRVTPPIGTSVTSEQAIHINFDWHTSQYELMFSQCDPSEFINGFANWLFDVFDGGFLFKNDDLAFGYKLPKTLIKQLESIGVKNDAG